MVTYKERMVFTLGMPVEIVIILLTDTDMKILGCAINSARQILLLNSVGDGRMESFNIYLMLL